LISLIAQDKNVLPNAVFRRLGQSRIKGTCFVVPASTSPLTWFITLIVCSLT
jgi:hypothetical protein